MGPIGGPINSGKKLPFHTAESPKKSAYISSEIQKFNFGYLSSRYYIDVHKDVRICSYFSKLKGVH